jgi:hypothetical protein
MGGNVARIVAGMHQISLAVDVGAIGGQRHFHFAQGLEHRAVECGKVGFPCACVAAMRPARRCG